MAPLDAAGSHLRACELCWLATDGPHGLTCCALYYALPEPWCLLVMSSEQPRHVANLKAGSACSVCVPRIPSFFGEPARQLTARCDGLPLVDSVRVEADAELFYARYPPARDFVEQGKRMRPEAELVPIRLRLVEGEYLAPLGGSKVHVRVKFFDLRMDTRDTARIPSRGSRTAASGGRNARI